MKELKCPKEILIQNGIEKVIRDKYFIIGMNKETSGFAYAIGRESDGIGVYYSDNNDYEKYSGDYLGMYYTGKNILLVSERCGEICRW